MLHQVTREEEQSCQKRHLNPNSEKVEGTMKKGTKNIGISRYMTMTRDHLAST